MPDPLRAPPSDVGSKTRPFESVLPLPADPSGDATMPLPTRPVDTRTASNDHTRIGATQLASKVQSNQTARLGRYRIEHLLGEGGFGQVFRAYDEDLRRHVAIKVMRSQPGGDSAQFEAYLTEARLVASLDHPSIVPVYDVVTEATGEYYVVSKLITGGDLRRRIEAAGGKAPLAWSVAVVRAVAGALSHAHRQGLVHRDVKPENILLGDDDRVYLSDFGLAIPLSNDGTACTAGTPRYMSPEQWSREHGQVDARSDIWALGVVLYELLTGRQPFCGGSISEIYEEVRAASPVRPRQLDPQVPPALEAICLRCLEADPARRFASIDDLGRALQSWLTQIEGLAAPAEGFRPRSSQELAAQRLALPLDFDGLIEHPARFEAVQAGPYLLREVVGHGGSGVVFLGTDLKLGREVAVKVCYPLADQAEVFLAPLARGARGLSAIDHPFIYKVLDFSLVDLPGGKSFLIAMGFIHGRPLDVWSQELSRSKSALSKRLSMAIGLAAAMLAAHEATWLDETGFEQRGVLHGDLKPSNILVRDDGSPAIIDFLTVDVERLLDPRVVPAQLLAQRIVPQTGAYGTPGFMAPEQAKAGIVTSRTDIFSLGRTLAWLFSPEDPERIVHGRDPWSSASPLVKLLNTMIDADPAQRPRGMRAVLEALESVQKLMK